VPIVRFKGKVLPYDPSAFVIDVKDLPPVEWNDQYTSQKLKITTRIIASIIDIEFEVETFSVQRPRLHPNGPRAVVAVQPLRAVPRSSP
jgi:hypothetical protein